MHPPAETRGAIQSVVASEKPRNDVHDTFPHLIFARCANHCTMGPCDMNGGDDVVMYIKAYVEEKEMAKVWFRCHGRWIGEATTECYSIVSSTRQTASYKAIKILQYTTNREQHVTLANCGSS